MFKVLSGGGLDKLRNYERSTVYSNEEINFMLRFEQIKSLADNLILKNVAYVV